MSINCFPRLPHRASYALALQGCAIPPVPRAVRRLQELEAVASAPKGVVGLRGVKTRNIFGDGNCLFRAVVQAVDDPSRSKRYVFSTGLPWLNADKQWEFEQACSRTDAVM